MNKFSLFVIKLLLRNFSLVLLLMVVLLAISSAYADMRTYSDLEGFTIGRFVLTIFYSMLRDLNKIMTIIAAVTVMMTVLMLMRTNELLAFLTIGGSLVKLAIPFVIFGVFLSSLMLVFEFKIIPYSILERAKISSLMKNNDTSVDTTGFKDTWFVGSDNKIINIGLVSIVDKTIYNVKEYILSDNNRVSKILYIDKIVKIDDNWYALDTVSKEIDKNPPIIRTIDKYPYPSDMWDKLSNLTTTDQRAFTPKELYSMITVLKDKGLNTTDMELSLYVKITSAISVIVLVLFLYPIAINFSRNYSIMKNILITFSFALFFILFSEITKVIGKKGIIDPLIITTSPIFIFLLASLIVIYKRSKSR